jgi:GTP cyclohydrolase II
VEAPEHAAASLLLAKLGHLLPAVLAAPAPAGGVETARRLGIASVRVEHVQAAPDGIATALRRVAEARVPLEGAEDARVVAFRATEDGVDHLAILIGEPETAEAPLVRLHSECFTGDLLGSLRCDCGPQLHGAIRRMAGEGAGVLLYLAQEGRGIGLANKLRAYALQDRGLDTLDANRALGFEPDERSFAVAATMLRQLGVTRLRLLTNNPDKLAALGERGIDVVGREEHTVAPNGINDHYLATKARRFGHLLD